MRITQIQALRAFAAILVVIYHAKLTPGGYIGVDIFYVISGYLITGLLLRELSKTSNLSLKSFYLRRVKRLLPTSFFVLVITAITAWIFFPSTMRSELGKDVAAAGIYIANYLFAFWQMDYQNLNAMPPVVIHYWSLAVEEQFYLFWPFLIYFTYRRGERRLVGIVIAAITTLSFLFSLYQTHTSPIWAFYSLPTRAWELGVGALLLYIPSRIRFSSNYVWLAVLLLTYGTFRFNDATAFPGSAALVPVAGTALALAAVQSWPPLLNSLGNTRLVQWLGEISYPLYLWHWPVLVIPAVFFGRNLHIYERVICIAFTLLLADLTHRYIEEPFRHKTFASKRVIAGAVGATVFSLVISSGIYFTSTDRITIGPGASYSLAAIMQKPLVYSDGCHVNNGETRSPDCTYGDKASSRKIVLFGDSHAAQWFPALEKLATENGFALISLTKSACPGPAVKKVDTGAYKNNDCFAWRDYAFKRMAQMQPEAIIVSGFQHFELPAGYSSRRQWWREGEVKTFAQLRGSSRHIVYISDTPHPKRDIPSCLAAGHITRCNTSEKSEAIFAPGYQRINPTLWLCGDSCPAILGGTVVYRDSSHLTVAMSRKLSTQLASSLTALGVALK